MNNLGYEVEKDYGIAPGPSLSGTASAAFGTSILTGTNALLNAENWLANRKDPEAIEYKNKLSLVENYINQPGQTFGHRATNFTSTLMGSLLDPVAIVGGGVGMKALGVAGSYAIGKIPTLVEAYTSGAIARDVTSSFLKEDLVSTGTSRFSNLLPKNLEEALVSPLKSAGLMAGFTLPEEFNKNYDPIKNAVDGLGLVKAVGIQGGLGFALPPVGWLAAHIHGKIFPYSPRLADPNKQLLFVKKAMQKGDVSEEDFKWYENYVKNPQDQEALAKQGVPLLDKDAQPINLATGKINLPPFVTQEEFGKIQNTYYDKLASNVADKNEFIDTVASEVMDRNVELLASNPTLLNNVKAQVEDLASLLKRKEPLLAELDNFVNRLPLTEKISKDALSQSSLYNLTKKGESEALLNIPRHIENLIKKENEIKELKKQLGSLKRSAKTPENLNKLEKLTDRILNKEIKLNDERQTKYKLLSIDEELKSIEEKYLKKEKLPKNYNTKNDWYRLNDLAQFNKEAARLLANINAKAGFEMQQAYHDILKGLTDVAENSFREHADPNRIVNYMKEKIEKESNFKTDSLIDDDQVSIKTRNREVVDESALEKEFEKVNESEFLSSEEKSEFNQDFSRLKQWKASDETLANFIACSLEAANVRI